MKCVKIHPKQLGAPGCKMVVRRVSEEDVTAAIRAGWQLAAKHEWKRAGRKYGLTEDKP